MYRITGWFPKAGQMGGCGFAITLTQAWKEAVAKSELNQEKVDNLIDGYGKGILEGHGMNIEDSHVKYYFRISWGEWGTEHITVPGNACGLDIYEDGITWGENEVQLAPHNVDTISQASMILTLFLRIAEFLEAEKWQRENNK